MRIKILQKLFKWRRKKKKMFLRGLILKLVGGVIDNIRFV